MNNILGDYMNKKLVGLISILVLIVFLILIGGASSFLNSKEGYAILFLILLALAYFIVSMLEKVTRETQYVFLILILYAVLVLVGIIPPFRTRTGGVTTPVVMLGFILISAIIAGYLYLQKQKAVDR